LDALPDKVRRGEPVFNPRRTITLLLGALVALLVGSAPALADTATLSFLDASGRSDPAVDLGRTFTLTGNTGTAKHIYVKYRATGGAACAPSASSDSGNDYLDGVGYSFYPTGTANGNFTFSATGVWQHSGTYMFCIWFANSSGDTATPIRQDITFREPTGTVSGSISPVSPLVNQTATVTITGSSEAPKRVYATYRLAGGAPCSVSYDADSGRGLVDGTNVNGAFGFTQSLTISTPGTYVICMWLADSSGDTGPVAGPQTATFTVPAPCVVPELSPGATLSSVKSQLAAGNCGVGATSREASTTIKSGRLIRLGSDSGAQLAPGSPVSIVLSSGRPCVVPASPSGLTLSRARKSLKAAGCTAGKVTHVRSHRRRGTVVSFSPRAGRTLPSRAVVAIRVSRGRR
jgi:hypothetical protein